VSEDQEYCICMLSEWAGGRHHLPKVYAWGVGVCINHHGDLSTFDYNRLTRLVLLAHRDAVRIEIASSGPRRVKIIAHRRKHGEGLSMFERHPCLADLAAIIDEMREKVTA